MSEGRVHVRASIVLAVGFSAGALISQDYKMLECAIGALTGLFLTPDLDVDGTYIGEKIIQKRLGLVPRMVWNAFWKPYKRSLKHGGMFSHFPVISTFLRLLYVFWWLIVIPHVLAKLLGDFHWELMYVLEWYGKLFLSTMFFIGLASSDLIHWTLDVCTKEKS